ncbi:MAG: hypothetical protein HZB19_14030 [Chloroflexi bacterium]|nr:hypothetical protein [Chloroflexota bacterium]
MKTSMNMLRIMDDTGSLRDALAPLAEQNINIKFLSAISIDKKYGLIHLLPENQLSTSDLPKSSVVFNELSIDIISVTVQDQVGSLKKMLDVVADSKINLSFCFAFSLGDNKAVAILGTPSSDVQRLQNVLESYEE